MNDNLLFIECGGCIHVLLPSREILPSNFYADEIVHEYIKQQDEYVYSALEYISDHFELLL